MEQIEQNESAFGEPWMEMDKIELEEAVSKAVGTLSDEIREVFLLRREGVGFKEIAEIQRCPVNTAIGRMQCAMKKIQKSLTDWQKGARV